MSTWAAVDFAFTCFWNVDPWRCERLVFCVVEVAWQIQLSVTELLR